MTFQPVPDVAQLQLSFSVASQTVTNSFYFHSSLGVGSGLLAVMAASVDAGITSYIAPRLSTATFILPFYLRDLSTQFGAVLTLAPTSGAGTRSGQVLVANQNTIAIKFATGLAGRGRQGRIFWPALYESVVTGNVVDGTELIAIINAVEDFVGDIASDMAGEHVVVHRVINGVRPSEAEYSNVTAVLATNSQIDSQRRRMPGYGT
jgi:hypothetical protein